MEPLARLLYPDWSLRLGTNAQVSHTSFIHGDSRYFASSLAISESIKKSTGFETIHSWRAQKEKKKEVVHQHDRNPDADNHSSIGSVCQLSINKR